MAKISPIWGAMSGSIRGCVFSHNKGGAYVRGRTIPTNPTSVKQSFIRAAVATLSSGWSGLSAGDQVLWNQWAALNPITDSLGLSVQRSGQQAYVGLNVRLALGGVAAISTPPPVTGPSDLLTLVVTATAPSGISAAFTASPLPAGSKLLLWQTLPGSAGRDPNRRQSRLIGITAAAAASPAVFVSPYPGMVGQTANFWAQVMDANGLVSPGIRDAGTYV